VKDNQHIAFVRKMADLARFHMPPECRNESSFICDPPRSETDNYVVVVVLDGDPFDFPRTLRNLADQLDQKIGCAPEIKDSAQPPALNPDQLKVN